MVILEHDLSHFLNMSHGDLKIGLDAQLTDSVGATVIQVLAHGKARLG